MQYGDDDDASSSVDAALAAFGLCADAMGITQSPATFYLWPCNVKTWGLWQSLQTQWRYGGMGSATGLDYAGVLAYLRQVAHIRERDLADHFAGIQAMERACLQVWADQHRE